MRPNTRACLAFVAVFAGSACAASANNPAIAGWASVAPSVTGTHQDSITNPLATERDTKQRALKELRTERNAAVNLDFDGFGTISAARRIGTIEHAYSKLAYSQFRTLNINDSSLPVYTDESAQANPTAESLGIDISDETPYEVRRILLVLFKGVESDRASVYHTWAQNLSTTHLDAALHKLAELVEIESIDSAIAEEPVHKIEIRTTRHHQLALAQLRNAKEIESAHKPTLKELDRLRGVISTSGGNNTQRDREALRSILLGRIAVPDATLAE